METMKVKFCPFCGHHAHKLIYSPVNVSNEDGIFEARDIWQMECKYCGARGPTESTPLFAIKSWNAIYREPAHDDNFIYNDFTFDIASLKKGNT